jgi:hypothetical protein
MNMFVQVRREAKDHLVIRVRILKSENTYNVGEILVVK